MPGISVTTATRKKEKPVKRRAAARGASGKGLPLYKKIKLDVTRALSRGKYDPNEPLPTERQLAERYRASVGTVRRAMDELVAEHIVMRQQGRGTFIARFSPARMLNRFWRVVRKDGCREIPIVQTVTFEQVPASKEAAEALSIPEGDPVYHIVNVLLLGGNPVLLDDVLAPDALFPGMTERDFVARDTTMYGFYQERYGVSVFRVVDRLGAVVADSKTARRLSIPVFTPLLAFTRVAYAFGDRPVEYRRTWFHTYAYEYLNEIGDGSHGVP
jgi:GntR family transcriptional regulator